MKPLKKFCSSPEARAAYFQCTTCKVVGKIASMKEHQRVSHADGNRTFSMISDLPETVELLQYSCELCGQKFQFKNKATLHMAQDHQKPDLNTSLLVAVTVESKRLKRTNATILKRKTEQEQRPLMQCPYCNEMVRSTVVHQHMRRHILPFKCGHCDQSFSMHYSVTLHSNAKHPGLEVSITKDENVKAEALQRFYAHQGIMEKKTPSMARKSSQTRQSKAASPLEGFSYYKKPPEPIDLTRVNVSVRAAYGINVVISADKFCGSCTVQLEPLTK